jgi:hypothetical protein
LDILIKVGEKPIGKINNGYISNGAESGTIVIAGNWNGHYPFYPNNQIDAWDLYDAKKGFLIATGGWALPVNNQINPFVHIKAIPQA